MHAACLHVRMLADRSSRDRPKLDSDAALPLLLAVCATDLTDGLGLFGCCGFRKL
jgi:hypothetical protein